MELLEYVFLISLSLSLIILNSPIIWKGLKEISNGREELELKKVNFGKKLIFWGFINIIGLVVLIIKFLVGLIIFTTEYPIMILYFAIWLISIFLISYLLLIFYYIYAKFLKF